MTDKMIAQTQVVLDRTLLLEMLTSGERILEGVSTMVDGLRVIATKEETELNEPVVDAPAEVHVWATDEVSMREYDAAQLVALRADHRADNHEPAECVVCGVLEQRLGSL